MEATGLMSVRDVTAIIKERDPTLLSGHETNVLSDYYFETLGGIRGSGGSAHNHWQTRLAMEVGRYEPEIGRRF